jgi:hypothetical protein
MDYLEGASYTMDKYGASARIRISKPLAQQIIDYIDERLSKSSDPKEIKLLEQLGKRRFEWQLKIGY